MDQPQKSEIYFDDPRLRMTVAGRLLVRVVSWIAYLVFLAATFTFLIAGDDRLRIAGVFLGLILLDQLIHRGQADRPIDEIQPGEHVNIAGSISPAAFLVLERGFDAGILAKRNFFLEMTEQLLDIPAVQKMLRHLDVPIKEFREKLDEFAAKKIESRPTREEYLIYAQKLVIAAFDHAVAKKHKFVEVADLFLALASAEDKDVNHLFELFSIDPKTITLSKSA